jgi:hypothetical protein
LITKARLLKKQIEKEEQMINLFAKEQEVFEDKRTQIEGEIDEKRAELIGKEKEISEQQEQYFIEKNINKQQIKQVMYRKLEEHYGKRIQIQKKIKEVQDENDVVKQELRLDERGLRKELKEGELSHLGYLYNMKFEKQKEASRLRDEYERRIYELQNKFKLKNDKIVRDLELKGTFLVKELEEKKKEKILQITGENQRRYKEIENYFTEITMATLTLIKHLKFEIKKAQKNEDRDKRALVLAEEEEKQLRGPLKRINENIKKLEEDKKEWLEIKEQKRKYRKLIESLKKQFRDLEFDYEVIFQQNQYSNDLYKKIDKAHQESLFQVQQKAGLKNLILRKQVELAKKGKFFLKS